MSTFQRFVSGKFSKRAMVAIQLGNFSVLWVSWGIAWALFPGAFSFVWNYICDLESPVTNPRGYVPFVIGIFTWSALLVPLVSYFYQHLRETDPALAAVGAVTGWTSCLCFFLIGIFPEYYPVPHRLVTSVAFGGCGGCGLIFFIVLCRDLWTRRSASHWPAGSLGAFIVPIGIVILAALALLVWESVPVPLVQWIIFVTVQGWLLATLLLSPRGIPDHPVGKNREK